MTMSTTIEIREAIANSNEDFMVTFSQGDAAGTADLYTDDGQVLPPNSDFATSLIAVCL